MQLDTLEAEDKKNKAVEEFNDLGIKEIYEKLSGYISDSNQTFWHQLIKFLESKKIELVNNDVKETVLDFAKKNIININPDFEHKRVNQIRFFAATDQLSSILNDAYKNYKYHTDDKYKKEYESRLEQWDIDYKKAEEDFKKSDEYKKYLKKLDKYNNEKTKSEKNGKKTRKPKKPTMNFRAKPETGREPTRYQAIFIGYALNCSTEEVEETFLRKALNQRGFNLKNPLDALCYCGLKRQTNKYGFWLNLKEKFENLEVKSANLLKENINTISAKSLADENVDFFADSIDDVFNYIINNMYISDEVYKRMSNNNADVITGDKIIKYCIEKKHSNDVDCFSGSSTAALTELKNLLKSKYRNNIEYFDEQIKKVAEEEKEERDRLSLELNGMYDSQFSKEDYINLIKQIKLINKKYQKIYEDLRVDQDQQQYGEDDFNEDVVENTLWEEEAEFMSGELYKALAPSLTDLHRFRARGMFDEPILDMSHIQTLLNKTKTVERGDIILTSFYIESIGMKRKELSASERVANFEEKTNGFLARSGYSKLYYPNPYEALLAILISTDFPLLALSEIMKNNLSDYVYIDEGNNKKEKANG